MNNLELNFDIFREYAETNLKNFEDVGIGIAFISEDETLFSEGMGFRDLEKSETESKAKEEPKKELPIKDTKPSRQLDEYLGIYTHLGYGELEFFIEDGQLATLYGKNSKLKTEHYYFDTFSIYVTTLGKFAVSKLVTIRDNFEGEITHLEINAEPLTRPAIFTKIKQ